MSLSTPRTGSGRKGGASTQAPSSTSNLSGASKCEGFRLIARLRERGRRYPIVIMSHNRGVEFEVRGFEAGADDYMVKWPKREEMRAWLRRLMAGSSGEIPDPPTRSEGP